MKIISLKKKKIIQMQKPDKTDKKQTKFLKGNSGNSLGRPKGVRNKATNGRGSFKNIF